ncbi:sialate O-acetylesterase [Mucilaginibacter sp. NFR10]|uniref:sialate O-acetylesterase n=1 Tax=Mucilaginibacter sp. NFR10 TaxID=1566292 RepID=UPI000871ABFE|nr:sialate O-acetylesterase [Mucilaginibacter sp. NFR10]SCW74091.1 sialate O-acetylesterase [Mucilaginibacter sp. NFR10]
MILRLIKYCWLTICLLSSGIAGAQVVLPKVLGNNMVLQRNAPVPVWGTASPGEKVTVKFNKQTKTTVADAAGKWMVKLDAMPASVIPTTLTISGKNTIQLQNILVGEVWLCSGQSNMQYEMRKNSKVKKPDTSTSNSPVDELDRAHNPQIRIFLVTQKNMLKPDSTHSGWSVAEDSALRAFSAAGYFFAKNLQHDLKVPVGIISSAVSGSRIEPWVSQEGFDAIPYFKANNIKIEGDPGKFYAKMIEPVAPFALKGFLWYQGESACFLGETISYTYKMEALINNWRKLWGDKKLPFYYVQIAPYYYTLGKGPVTYTPFTEPELREAQAVALQIPNTGMIITTDLNDDLKNIHPPFKWEVGRRLELQALANTYKQRVVFSGPVYKHMKINGDKIILEFDHVGAGLVNHDGKPLTDFTIAGADGNFVAATATIKGNTVEVSAQSVTKPVAARFAWSESAQPNFYNKEGLPAAPFRTNNPLKFTLTAN